MDGENNGKPYLEMGWFGGTIVFGNTHIAFMGLVVLGGLHFWRNFFSVKVLHLMLEFHIVLNQGLSWSWLHTLSYT